MHKNRHMQHWEEFENRLIFLSSIEDSSNRESSIEQPEENLSIAEQAEKRVDTISKQLPEQTQEPLAETLEITEEQAERYLTFITPTAIPRIPPEREMQSFSFYEAQNMISALQVALRHMPAESKSNEEVQTISRLIEQLKNQKTRLAAGKQLSHLCQQMEEYKKTMDTKLRDEKHAKRKQEYDEQKKSIKQQADLPEAEQRSEILKLNKSFAEEANQKSLQSSKAFTALQGLKERHLSFETMTRNIEQEKLEAIQTLIPKIVESVASRASDPYIMDLSVDELELAEIEHTAGEKAKKAIENLSAVQQFEEYKKTIAEYRDAVALIKVLPNAGTIMVPEECARIIGMTAEDSGSDIEFGGVLYRVVDEPGVVAKRLSERMAKYKKGGELLHKRLLKQIADLENDYIPNTLEDTIYNNARLTEGGDWRIKDAEQARSYLQNYASGSNDVLRDETIDARSTIRSGAERPFREDLADSNNYTTTEDGDLLLSNSTMQLIDTHTNSLIEEQFLQGGGIYIAVDAEGNIGVDNKRLAQLKPEYMQDSILAKQLQLYIEQLDANLEITENNALRLEEFTEDVLQYFSGTLVVDADERDSIEKKSKKLRYVMLAFLNNAGDEAAVTEAKADFIKAVQNAADSLESNANNKRAFTLQKLREYHNQAGKKQPLVIKNIHDWSLADVHSFGDVHLKIEDTNLTNNAVKNLSKCTGTLQCANIQNITAEQIHILKACKAKMSVHFSFDIPTTPEVELALREFVKSNNKRTVTLSLMNGEDPEELTEYINTG